MSAAQETAAVEGEGILAATRTGMSLRDLGACAAALLLIDDARLYGLVDGGPEVDRGRCEQVLEELARARVWPTEDEMHAKVLELLAELGAVRG